MPTIDIRKLSAFGEEIPIELDTTQGWQRQRVFLAAEDFLYIRIQAAGRGMIGTLKFDVLSESDTLNGALDNASNDSFNEVDIEVNTANQSVMNPRQVSLESGGSLSLWCLLLMIALLGRVPKTYSWA